MMIVDTWAVIVLSFPVFLPAWTPDDIQGTFVLTMCAIFCKIFDYWSEK